ncbi:endonuclease/exonuclease/phosphatase family protein [Algibacter sp. AS12]|uniref:endonuclease/exonuclease/phosphatase family protein n=1 Tax=Algibacter sp. AS12 TaxID=3135773 RepID=UPI00398B6207
MEYYRIKYFKKKEYIPRCVLLLKELRRGLDSKIPERRLNETLIFGSWNIREFDCNSKKFGPRKEDDFVYIAEIISRFDVLAIQEINDDLAPLQKVMGMLGDEYEYILTDVAAWKSGGNNERLGFIYDKRTVKFNGVAGELVLPQNMLIRNNDGVIERQFARTPFKCSFQAGWFKFKVTTVHIYYGKDSEKSNHFKRRVEEIDKVAKLISENAEKEGTKKDPSTKWFNPYNYFIVGDFNIVNENNVTYDALAKYGFETIKNRKGSNKDRTKFYDQISYYKTSNLDFDWKDSNRSTGKDHNNTDRIFNFFNYIYTEDQFPLFKTDIVNYITRNKAAFKDDIEKLKIKIEGIEAELALDTISKTRRKTIERQLEKAKETQTYTKNLVALKTEELTDFYLNSPWNTFQVSDHLPLWAEINIDKSDEYLDNSF